MQCEMKTRTGKRNMKGACEGSEAAHVDGGVGERESERERER
jgi:hypothetical protein